MKSDDVVGRVKTYEAIIKGENIPAPGVPESFKVLLKELQSLGLDVRLLNEGEEVEVKEDVEYNNTDFNSLLNDRSLNGYKESFEEHGFSQQEFKDGELVNVEEPVDDSAFEEEFSFDESDDQEF